jgi:hypothetical protein
MHYTDDELILYYYGEHRHRERVERHLSACAACDALYREIAGSLQLVADPEVPARTDQYGLEVWQRIRHRLPEQDAPWWAIWARPYRLALAGSAIALIVAAFVAGRWWPVAAPLPAAVEDSTAARDPGEGVRLAAVGDHLEQTARVLLDLVNISSSADQPADISDQQGWAADLVVANRLYREASVQAGDDSVAAVLDELERQLLEIVHGPAALTPDELDRIRMRLDAAALLFRVRILSDQLRERELAPHLPRNIT